MRHAYGNTKIVPHTFEKAVERVKEALMEEGFGVLTEINVQETLKKKLDVDMDRYLILGACNPPYAHRALQTEQEVGLLLPCNVIVYEQDGKTHVAAIRPTAAMAMVEKDTLGSIAEEIEQKLMNVMKRV